MNEAATLSLRTIVGACTGIVISTASDICLFESETASKRTFVGARFGSVTFALKRNTVGASRCADWVVTSPPSNLMLASVTHRVVTPSLSAKFCRTTARNSTSSPSRKKRGNARSIRSGFDIFTVCGRVAAELIHLGLADRHDAICGQVIRRDEFERDLAVSASLQTALPKRESAKFFANIFDVRDRFLSAIADDESFWVKLSLARFSI